jgi:hypothetical protein
MNIRIRGIYATALTEQFLSAGHDIVDASPPIQRRFDATFESGPVDVSVYTTENRQGVGVTGTDTAVTEASDQIQDVGRDALGWDDPTPPGAVFDGRVTNTLGGGAVVDLGPQRDISRTTGLTDISTTGILCVSRCARVPRRGPTTARTSGLNCTRRPG